MSLKKIGQSILSIMLVIAIALSCGTNVNASEVSAEEYAAKTSELVDYLVNVAKQATGNTKEYAEQVYNLAKERGLFKDLNDGIEYLKETIQKQHDAFVEETMIQYELVVEQLEAQLEALEIDAKAWHEVAKNYGLALNNQCEVLVDWSKVEGNEIYDVVKAAIEELKPQFEAIKARVESTEEYFDAMLEAAKQVGKDCEELNEALEALVNGHGDDVLEAYFNAKDDVVEAVKVLAVLHEKLKVEAVNSQDDLKVIANKVKELQAYFVTEQLEFIEEARVINLTVAYGYKNLYELAMADYAKSLDELKKLNGVQQEEYDKLVAETKAKMEAEKAACKASYEACLDRWCELCNNVKGISLVAADVITGYAKEVADVYAQAGVEAFDLFIVDIENLIAEHAEELGQADLTIAEIYETGLAHWNQYYELRMQQAEEAVQQAYEKIKEQANAQIEEVQNAVVSQLEKQINTVVNAVKNQIEKQINTVVEGVLLTYYNATNTIYTQHHGSSYLAFGDDSALSGYVEKVAEYFNVNYTNLAAKGAKVEDLVKLIEENAQQVAAADFITIGYANVSYIDEAIDAIFGVDLAWEKLIGNKNAQYVQRIENDLADLLIENGVEEAYVDYIINAAEAVVYNAVAYTVYVPQAIAAIKEINPDAQIAVVGQYNPLYGSSICLGDNEYGIGEYVDYFVEALDAYGIATAVLTQDAIYVEANEVETINNVEKFGLADLLNIARNISALNPSEDGAEYIANQIIDSVFVEYLGDVNGDGKVTSRDAVLVLQYYSELIDEDGLNIAVADVNGDGKISSRDATLILQYYSGLIESFD